MKIQLDIPDSLVRKIITGIMENFPEASGGNSLLCIGWKYEALEFKFVDSEEEKKYNVGPGALNHAFDLMFAGAWPKGCTQPPFSANWEDWENWLCQSDTTDFDAFVQLAIFGEVIYG